MSLHRVSVSFHHPAALCADIAPLFEFLGDGLSGLYFSCNCVQLCYCLLLTTSCRGRSCLARQPMPVQVLVPLFVPVPVPVPLFLPNRLLSESPTHRLVPATGKRQGLPITAPLPMQVIRHTVSQPLLLHPANALYYRPHRTPCARQTIRQHGFLFVQRGSRMATRSKTPQRDDAHLLGWCPQTCLSPAPCCVAHRD